MQYPTCLQLKGSRGSFSPVVGVQRLATKAKLELRSLHKHPSSHFLSTCPHLRTEGSNSAAGCSSGVWCAGSREGERTSCIPLRCGSTRSSAASAEGKEHRSACPGREPLVRVLLQLF